MDAYKTPEANLEVAVEKAFKPVKAILYGLLISIGLVLVVSIIALIAFAIAFGINLTDDSDLTPILANNLLFLSSDLVITGVVLYFSPVQ